MKLETLKGFTCGHFKVFEKDGVQCGYVAGLYLTPQVAGRSLGKVIVDSMVEEAKAAKVRRITLESSITARSFYRRIGFVDAGPQTTVEIAGVPIRCFPMSMEIDSLMP